MRNLLRNLRIRLFRSRSGRFVHDEHGTTAVEYAVMLAMILLVMIGTIATFGGQTGNLWGDTNTKLNNAGFGS